MKKFLILGLVYFHATYGNPSLDEYFFYIKKLSQSSGDYRKGEIEIVMDPAEILKIQEMQETRLLQAGFSATDAIEFSRVGVVREDQYWIWLRDAVYFPNGKPGTYDRLIWKTTLNRTSPGVAVLPILPSGHVVLNLNYRHATRSWELELPRGGLMPLETIEEAAMRELKEETGFTVSSLIFLGEIAADTGVLSSVTSVFIGNVSAQEESMPEYSEAIADVIFFTKAEVREGLTHGYLEVSIQGEKKQVPLRDAFLTFALLQAELRKLL